jgi:hypothetical protein
MSIVAVGLPAALHHGWALAAASGNRLYTVVNGFGEGGMYCLEDAAPAAAMNDADWSWSRVPSPLPFGASLMESIAVHPEGGLFVSMGPKEPDMIDYAEEDLGQDMQSSTFSYDAGSGEWRSHGDWVLPFYGQAHYDGGLDAWVGLRKVYTPPNRILSPDRYICSCDVVSPAGSSAPPSWKLCTEMLCNSYQREGSLVYMGDSTYCLVKVVERERFRRRRCASTGNKSMISLTRFGLQYGKSSELTIARRRPDRSYFFSRYGEHLEVRAFWI